MDNLFGNEPSGGEAPVEIQVADEMLNWRPVHVARSAPTGAELARAAGFEDANVAVLHVVEGGELDDIRPTETVDLHHSTSRFIIVATDREYLFTIDDRRFSWPSRIISGGVVRRLARIPAELTVYLRTPGGEEEVVEAGAFVDLDQRGVEAFFARRDSWKLNVQGVVLDLPFPVIQVDEALRLAGFDNTQEWHIFLKVVGSPKKEVSLADIIDLKTPGIEKLRLTPKNVNNGEGPIARREFLLLDLDHRYLNETSVRWETVVDGGRRWLMLHDYPVPPGFNHGAVRLALEIPPTYPGAQIDMFYTNPPLLLASGSAIDCTHIAASIGGEHFNGWSRHRGPGSEWNPVSDNVITHLALVESAMMKEVGE